METVRIMKPLSAPSRLLLADGLINILLGALLVFAPRFLEEQLGMPPLTGGFYGSILGAVLLGIGMALLWERSRGSGQSPGLGMAGAIAINLSAAMVLIVWLLSGRLAIPLIGHVVLWLLVAILIGISLLETLAQITNR